MPPRIRFLSDVDPVHDLFRLTAQAHSCVVRSSASKLLENRLTGLKMEPDQTYEKSLRIIRHSIGHGHVSLLDHLVFHVSFEDVDRLFTLTTARYPYGISLLQQSTRRVKIKEDNLPWDLTTNLNYTVKMDVEDYLNETYGIYNRLLQGRNKEEAMLVLPLGIKTNTTLTINGRGVVQLVRDSDTYPETVSSVVREFYTILTSEKLTPQNTEGIANYDWAFSKEYSYWEVDSIFYGGGLEHGIDFFLEPQDPRYDQIVSHTCPEDLQIQKTGENSDPYDLRFKLYVSVDLSILHELLRHRTIDFQIEPITHAVEEPTFSLPDVRDSNLRNDAARVMRRGVDLYKRMVLAGQSYRDALWILPHGLRVSVRMNLSGWNVKNLFMQRNCTRTKRGFLILLEDIKKQIGLLLEDTYSGDKVFYRLITSRCGEYRRCPETDDGRPPSDCSGPPVKPVKPKITLPTYKRTR